MAKVKETWLLVDNQQIDCKPKWEMFVTITTQEESDFIYNHRYGTYCCEVFCDGAISQKTKESLWYKKDGYDKTKKLSFNRYLMFMRDFNKNIDDAIEKYNVAK